MVANLTRYDLVEIRGCGEYDHVMAIAYDGEYVKFEEALVASSTSLQQLKAEIRALSNQLNQYYCRELGWETVQVASIIGKMRVLSAV